MKVKVSELEGRALNYAVAVCLWGEPENGPDCWREWNYQKENGLPFYVETSGKLDCLEFNPSGNWSHGGPLIEEWMISINYATAPSMGRHMWSARYGRNNTGLPRCLSPLVAAMRELVYLRKGYEIEIPDELMP